MTDTGYALESLNFLDWWLLAVVFGIAEAFVLCRWLVVPAMAAGVVGFALMLFPQVTWPWQLGSFMLMSAAALAMQGMRRTLFQYTSANAAAREQPAMSSLYHFKVKTIAGHDKSLKDFKGQTVLVVNVASDCGLTPQYAGLENLYREFKDRNFSILGLPCNQFGKQEPGSEAEIRQFCSTHYDVTFPLSSKIEVNGPGAHPLYQWLKSETGGTDIQWNFEKFLIGKDGRIIKRYPPQTTPEDPQLRKDLLAAL
jgi:glutathione peroxidase